MLRKNWDNVTRPKNDSRVYETKHVLVCQRLEVNAAQRTSVPRMIFHRFIPPNEEKFDSVRFVHVREANDVDMVYADDFGVTVLAALSINVPVFQQHYVAMRSTWVYDILRPPNVISGVVESCEIVVVKSITLEEDGTVLVGTSQHLRGRSSSFWLETT